MSDNLRVAQAELVASLLEGRVPDGFDAKGIDATAAVLRRKRRGVANSHPPRTRIRAVVQRIVGWSLTIRRLLKKA